jgi:hypothetical protein
MIASRIGLVLANRGGHLPALPRDTLTIALLIVAMLAGCGLIVFYLRRRSRRATPVGDQWQALAVMGELCPHGWQAQITLYGWGAPVPEDAPPSRVPLVELEWKQFAEESGQIGEALQSMVEDRRTDIALEQIEQAAAEDGDTWWSE